MSPFEIGVASLFLLIIFILFGMFVPVALMLISFLGVWAIKGDVGLAVFLMAQAANHAISNYFFGVIPLFVLMGFVVAESGLGHDAYDIANRVFRNVKGGLGLATVFANAIFAAITGISIASAAVFSRVAVPEMILHGYSPRFATGVVACSSVLGMLIPPSLLLVLYAVIADQSVGDMFLAGIIPGLILSVAFGVAIMGAARFRPQFLGDVNPMMEEKIPLAAMAGKAVSICMLIAIVFGGIYTGFFTPLEAGAIGSMTAILIAILQWRINARQLGRILMEAGLVTASICMLIIAAQMFSRMLAISGVTQSISGLMVHIGMGYWPLMLTYVVLLLLWGMILDSSSILLIMVPILLPVAISLGLDPVWFGIISVLTVEIGLLTPPFGLSVFVIRASLANESIPLEEIFRGALPFAIIMLLLVLVLLEFPILTTAFL